MSLFKEGRITRRGAITSIAGAAGVATLGFLAFPRPAEQAGQSPIPAFISKEKPPEKGWERFRSTQFPYQIDYPEDWTVQSVQGLEKKDVFKGRTVNGFQTNVTIFTEPVGSWVNEEAYRDNLISRLTVKNPEGKIVFLPGSWKVKIGTGREVYVVGDLISRSPTLARETAFIINDRKLWQITNLSADVQKDSKDYQIFEKMLSTFKFLS